MGHLIRQPKQDRAPQCGFCYNGIIYKDKERNLLYCSACGYVNKPEEQ